MDITYEETEGMHNWIFWNEQLPKILNWLPLQDEGTGLNSGNVKV